MAAEKAGKCQPYYQDEHVTLYHGDWRELIGDLHADLILTDPPYGETTLEWDSWPIGWPALAVRHAHAMWCFGSMRMLLAHRDEFAGWRLSQDVVWEKHNGSSLASDRFTRVHEFATHWYHGPWASVHHKTPKTYDSTARTVRRKAKPTHHQGARGPSHYTSIDGGPRLMRSVMAHRSMHGRGATNETQKPVSLLEPLIQYGCPIGGTVLDLFAGSGSTLVAARNMGRHAIGFELREDQCEHAARRFAQGVLEVSGSA